SHPAATVDPADSMNSAFEINAALDHPHVSWRQYANQLFRNRTYLPTQTAVPPSALQHHAPTERPPRYRRLTSRPPPPESTRPYCGVTRWPCLSALPRFDVMF